MSQRHAGFGAIFSNTWSWFLHEHPHKHNYEVVHTHHRWLYEAREYRTITVDFKETF